MGFDLGKGLRDLSGTPDVPDVPVSPDTVVGTVRRRRTMRTALTAGLGAAAVLVLAVAVQAAPWQSHDLPPADPAPTTVPTDDPITDETGAPADPEDVQDQEDATEQEDASVPELPSIIALTDAGDLVELDPTTGTTIRVILPAAVEPREGAAIGFATVSVTRDRTVAYVSDGPDREIRRVTLASGATETVVATGMDPVVSPDGGTLAYIEREFGVGDATAGLVLLDLESGERRYIPDSAYCECDRYLDAPKWSADGKTLLVTHGYSESSFVASTTVVDVSAPPADLNAESAFLTVQGLDEEPAQVHQAEYLADGRVVLVREIADYLAPDRWWSLVVRAPDGSSSESGRFTTVPPRDVVGEPGGASVLLVRPVLTADTSAVRAVSLTRVTLDGDRLWHVEGITAADW